MGKLDGDQTVLTMAAVGLAAAAVHPAVAPANFHVGRREEGWRAWREMGELKGEHGRGSPAPPRRRRRPARPPCAALHERLCSVPRTASHYVGPAVPFALLLASDARLFGSRTPVVSGERGRRKKI